MNRVIVNNHYYNRYIKFIQIMRSRSLVSEYNERHHILPKCLGGDDSTDNLITLSPREHYIAHMLLAMAYRNNFPIVSAFCQMAHKNIKKKTKHILVHRTYTSKVYQQLKIDLYKMVSHNNKGMVSCRDENNILHRVSSEEYRESDNLKFHTKGMVSCRDENNILHRVTSEEYKENAKLKFHTAGMVAVYSNITKKIVYVSSDEYKTNKHLYVHHCTKPKVYKENKVYEEQGFWITDLVTSVSFKVKYDEWLILKTVTYTRLGKIKPTPRFKMQKTFSDLHIATISKDREGNIPVFDTISNKHIIVTKEEYNSNIHKTSTAGKILAKNINGELCVVTNEEYANGNYVGQTKGLSKVTDKVTGNIVLVAKDEMLKNPDRYEGHLAGKTTVVDKSTGNRIIIPTSQYDKNLYCALGNKYFLIQGYDKTKPNKIKNINYFEYLHYPEKFVIIDTTKFEYIKQNIGNI